MNDLMRTCPKWESCNAPICPLDEDWELRTHIQDAICAFLREYAKIQAGQPTQGVFEQCLNEEAQKAIGRYWLPIQTAHRSIELGLIKASKTPSKLGVNRFKKGDIK